MENFLALKSIEKILAEAFPRIEQLCRESDWPLGITTGFKELDELTAGLQPATEYTLKVYAVNSYCNWWTSCHGQDCTLTNHLTSHRL